MAGVAPDTSTHLAEQFDDAFQRVYLTFHRRDGTDRGLSAASRSVLVHLMHSGPVTIAEATAHLGRAQSVVSDIVTQLEGNGLVRRERDAADRRRVVVWLTDAGLDAMRHDASVLSHDRLAAALTRLEAADVERALDLIRRLVAAAPTNHHTKER